MDISLDQQVVTQTCPDFQAEMKVVRGSVYDDGRPVGLYLIALHSDDGSDSMAHLAIALREGGRKPRAMAVALRVEAMPENIGFALIDWRESPWAHETYLGLMLDRSAALKSSLKSKFFHVAEHVVNELPDVCECFG